MIERNAIYFKKLIYFIPLLKLYCCMNFNYFLYFIYLFNLSIFGHENIITNDDLKLRKISQFILFFNYYMF
jgi:hypothetical protein